MIFRETELAGVTIVEPERHQVTTNALTSDLDRAGQDRLLAVALPTAAPPLFDSDNVGLVPASPSLSVSTPAKPLRWGRSRFRTLISDANSL